MTRKPAKFAARRDRRSPAAARAAGADVVRIFGFHAVRAALASPRRSFVRLFATAAAAERLAPLIEAASVPLTVVQADDISARLGADAVHQGALLEARPLPAFDIDDFADDAFLLVLDQVTDPHNFGAILRSAAAFGVDGVVTTERHSPAETGALAKSASGALELVPIAHVVNLSRALAGLVDRGFAVVGLDSEAEVSFADLDLTKPLALALGSEGKGLRRLTRERCSVVARLDLPGPIKSLNVSNACASALTLASLRLRIGRA
jgi:23S rRNA (guanosine2251-2'-O)-methyltransferase